MRQRTDTVTGHPSSSLPEIQAEYSSRTQAHQIADRNYVRELLRQERRQRAAGRRAQPSVLWRNARAVYDLDPETC